MNTRALALKSLVKCDRDSKFANLEINSTLDKNPMSDSDRGLYTALVYGVLEREMLLDYVLSPYLKKTVSSLDPEVRCALRLGAVQIFFFDKIPDHAVCDETVEIIKKSPRRSASGLVNAVLRSLVREKDSVRKKIENAPLSVKYSLPEWILNLWQSSYGEEKTLEILEGFSGKAPLTLHANTLKTTAEALSRKFEGVGVSCHIHPRHPDLVVLDTNINPEKLEGFSEGLFFVQGSASALAVKALGLQPDSRVLDVCACPGGKSFAAALELENSGEIFSFDLHESKLSLISKGAEKLGITIIKSACHDAREDFGPLVGTADFVIADVPCSGLGVISKKPDIRKKSPEDIARLPEIQAAILENVSKTLKKGGKLLYSTCTLNCAENENITDKFLENHPEFKRAEGFPITYFPKDEIEDGFFSDVLIKE